MIISITLDGYLSGKEENHLSFQVEKYLKKLIPKDEFLHYSRHSRLIFPGIKFAKKIIEANASKKNILSLTGKSFGAYRIITEIINKDPNIRKYYRCYGLTVDPCWPLLFDWKPNLNDRSLEIESRYLKLVNIYLKREDVQAGSMVNGRGITNIEVYDRTHMDIVSSPIVIEQTIRHVHKLRDKHNSLKRI